MISTYNFSILCISNVFYFLWLLPFFFSVLDWTQMLKHARQALYHQATSPAVCFGFLWRTHRRIFKYSFNLHLNIITDIFGLNLSYYCMLFFCPICSTFIFLTCFAIFYWMFFIMLASPFTSWKLYKYIYSYWYLYPSHFVLP
jgi:hypothetical protein